MLAGPDLELHRKCPLLLSSYEENWNTQINFRKLPNKLSHFAKTHSVFVDLLQWTYRLTDREEKLIGQKRPQLT